MASHTPTGRRAIRQRGFTLLGLLFLVAGLGVAMAALGTVWHTAAQREKERDLLFAGDQYRRAIESFWNVPLPADTPRRQPKSFAELLLDPRFPQAVRHLRRAYRDPMTASGEWGLIAAPEGGFMGVHSLSADAPFKTGRFGAANAAFEGAAAYSDWRFEYAPAANPATAALPPQSGAAGQGSPPSTRPSGDQFKP